YRMEGQRRVRDDRHARAVPFGDGQRHDEQGAALPAETGSAGEIGHRRRATGPRFLWPAARGLSPDADLTSRQLRRYILVIRGFYPPCLYPRRKNEGVLTRRSRLDRRS